MSFSTAAPREDYIGTGLVTEYDYNFWIKEATDLRVTQRDTDGVETEMVYITDYTVSGAGNANGGTVTLVDALADGYAMTIRFDRTPDQTADLRNQGTISLVTLENKFDELTRYVQSIRDVLRRCLHIPETEDGDNLTQLPSVEERASKPLWCNEDGAIIAVAGTLNELGVSSFAATLLDDANYVEALTTLGASEKEPTDTAFRIRDGNDQSKKVAFEANGITTGTTRTITVPNSDGTMALTSDILAASTTQAGDIELATQAEVDAGTAVRALTSDLNLTSQLAAVTLSGTSQSWTIPSGVKHITIQFMGVSLSGTEDLYIQIGDSGGVETSGYVSTGAAVAAAGVTVVAVTTGFVIKVGVAAATVSGIMTLAKHDSSNNDWVCSYTMKSSTTVLQFGGGQCTALSSALVTIRLKSGSTDTFDAGAVSVNYRR